MNLDISFDIWGVIWLLSFLIWLWSFIIWLISLLFIQPIYHNIFKINSALNQNNNLLNQNLNNQAKNQIIYYWNSVINPGIWSEIKDLFAKYEHNGTKK